MSLLALAGTPQKFERNGASVQIKGLPSEDLAALVTDHPAVLAFLEGREADLESLLRDAPAAFVKAIAKGTVTGLSFEDAMAEAKQLPTWLQIDLMAAILSSSFGKDEGMNTVLGKLAAVLGGNVKASIAASPAA